MKPTQYSSHIIKKEHLCPFCSKTFSLLNAPFRFGRSDVSIDQLEIDPYLKTAWFDEELYPPVYLPSKAEAVCVNIKVKNHANKDCILIDRLCANCHKKLPLNFFELETYRFAVIGSRHSGKSTFVRALMNSVANHLNFYRQIIVVEADPDDVLRKQTLNESNIIEATYLSFQIPIIYLINDTVRNKKYFVSLYDISGEVFEHTRDKPVLERLKEYAHYLPYSNGCIFLLDPLQTGTIRVRFEQEGLAAQLTTNYQEQRDVLVFTHQFLTQAKLTDHLAQSNQKACICFSKKDILEDQLSVQLTPETNIPQNAPTEILHALKRHAQQTSDVISNLGATEFISTFREFFPNSDQSVYAFAISTMNANMQVHAQNIEYPILWMCEMLDNLGQSAKQIATTISENTPYTQKSNQKSSRNIMIVILALILLVLTIISFSSDIHQIFDQFVNNDNEQVKQTKVISKEPEQPEQPAQPAQPAPDLKSKPSISTKLIDSCNVFNVGNFEISASEVSVKEYHQCVLSKVCSKPELEEAKGCTYTDIDGNEDLPINCISFEQAKTFAKWVNMSLPSQGQWQCAATDSGIYKKSYWGDSAVTCQYANYKDCKHAKPIKSCTTSNSSRGVCDLFGNVAEFTDSGNAVGGHYQSVKKDVSISNVIANAKASPHIGIRLVK